MIQCARLGAHDGASVDADDVARADQRHRLGQRLPVEADADVEACRRSALPGAPSRSTSSIWEAIPWAQPRQERVGGDAVGHGSGHRLVGTDDLEASRATPASARTWYKRANASLSLDARSERADRGGEAVRRSRP